MSKESLLEYIFTILVSKDTKVTYSCPTDKNYTLSGDKCYTEESKITGYTCDVGTLKNKKCISEKKVLTGYTCPSGYNLSSDKCYKKSDSTLVGYKCDDNSYTLNGKKCSKTITTTVSKEPNKTYKDSTTTEYTWSDKEKLFGWEFTGKKQTTKVCNGKG